MLHVATSLLSAPVVGCDCTRLPPAVSESATERLHNQIFPYVGHAASPDVRGAGETSCVERLAQLIGLEELAEPTALRAMSVLTALCRKTAPQELAASQEVVLTLSGIFE